MFGRSTPYFRFNREERHLAAVLFYLLRTGDNLARLIHSRRPDCAPRWLEDGTGPLHFRVRYGSKAPPLDKAGSTSVEVGSRVSPAVDVRLSYRGVDVVETLERVTARYGLPRQIRLDNGPEFISRDLDLWAYARGVVLDFSRPGNSNA